MHDISYIQSQLQNAIFNTRPNVDLSFIKSQNYASTQERLTIHRDTIFENYINSLKITYPGIWQLIGDDCARGVSLAYIHDLSNLSSRAGLNSFGDNFAHFLGSFPSTSNLPYIEDFATVEWMRSRSYFSQRIKHIEFKDFEKDRTQSIEGYVFTFNPSVFFLKSSFALYAIQELLNNPKAQNLQLDNGESFIVICKTKDKVETLYLHEPIWKLLQSFNLQARCGDAVELLQEDDPHDTLASVFSLMFNKNMISQYRNECYETNFSKI